MERQHGQCGKATKRNEDIIKSMKMENHFDEDRLIASMPLSGKVNKATYGKIDAISISNWNGIIDMIYLSNSPAKRFGIIDLI